MAITYLPITPGMNQSFTCTLPVDDKNITLDFTLTYNEPAGYWFMSIRKNDTGVLLIDALPLLNGEYPSANLLKQYSYLAIGSAVIISKSGKDSTPTFDSLGREHFVAWGDTP
ncbi:hypothetical protein ABEO98_22805 [Brevibacillus parabrevis]|uniref:phage baseplate plug family protein n=1 Tax=Brevibacillus parabrevis TaxID=54914 RepID=UPI003D1E0F6D